MTSIAISPLERIHRFTDELRSRGVPVSMVERLDAMRAARIAELDRSDGLRTALRATLVKSGDHLAVFEEVFDLYFDPAGARRAAQAGTPTPSHGWTWSRPSAVCCATDRRSSPARWPSRRSRSS